MRPRGRVAVAWLVCGLLATAAAGAVWQEARDTAEQQREFLRTARIVGARPIGKGVTGSLRLTLTDGTVTHDAAFQSVDERTSERERREGRRRAGEVNFVDSYKYNIAAYEIARLLALDGMMPPTVPRTYRGSRGSLTWWVDDVLMDEAERVRTNAQPPSAVDFQRQRTTMTVFAELVGDVDRNQGNVLYTRDWRVVMIDFTRAFRLHRALRHPDTLTQIDRELWERLQRLSRQEVSRAAGEYLTPGEVGAVMARREAIVQRYERLIRERGADTVLFDRRTP